MPTHSNRINSFTWFFFILAVNERFYQSVTHVMEPQLVWTTQWYDWCTFCNSLTCWRDLRNAHFSRSVQVGATLVTIARRRPNSLGTIGSGESAGLGGDVNSGGAARRSTQRSSSRTTCTALWVPFDRKDRERPNFQRLGFRRDTLAGNGEDREVVICAVIRPWLFGWRPDRSAPPINTFYVFPFLFVSFIVSFYIGFFFATATSRGGETTPANVMVLHRFTTDHRSIIVLLIRSYELCFSQSLCVLILYIANNSLTAISQDPVSCQIHLFPTWSSQLVDLRCLIFLPVNFFASVHLL